MKQWTRRVLESVKSHWKAADAQDLVEYALLLVMVSLAAVASVRTLGQRVSNVFNLAKANVIQQTNVGTGVIGLGAALGAGLGNTATADAAQAASIGALAASYLAAAQASNTGVVSAALFAAAGFDTAAQASFNAARAAAGNGNNFVANLAAALGNGAVALANAAVNAATNAVNGT